MTARDEASLPTRIARAFIAVAASVFCMWLAAAEIDSPREPHDYEIRVATDDALIDAAAKGKQVWMRDLQLDGRAATALDVAVSGPWRTDLASESWQWTCELPEAGSALRWRSKGFVTTVLRHSWSGTLEVWRDGALQQRVSLTSSDPGVTVVTSGAELDQWGLLAILVTASIAFLSLRPWYGHWRLGAWLGLIVGHVHATCWLHFPVGITGDTPYYLIAVDQLLAGEPSGFPPGYGVMLGAIGIFGGPLGVLATFVQHVLIVGLALLLYGIFRRWLGDSAAFVGACLGAVAYPSLFGAQAVMSETWTCILIAAALWLGVQSPRGNGSARALGAGLAAGWATLSRMVPLAALVPVFVARGLLPWRQRSWRWVALTAGVTAMAMAGLVLHNGLRSGKWELSTKSGRHLFNHFVYAQKLLDKEGTATKEMMAWIGAKDPRDLAHWDAGDLMVADSEAKWQRREQLFALVAWEAAKTVGPLEHLRFTIALTWRNLSTPANPHMAIKDWGQGRQPDLAHDALIDAPLETAQQWQRGIWFEERSWLLVCWLFVLALPATLLLRHGRFPWLCWVWTVWAYMFASSAIEYELPRYHAAVTPFVVMLAVGTVAVVGNALAARLRRAPPPSAGGTQ